MTADPTTRPMLDPAQLAGEARSILACPAGVSLVVDGHPSVLAEDALGMQDVHGTPTFSCPPGSELADAAEHHRSALITVESGLGGPGSDERAVTLTLAGRLETRGVEDCACCEETRHVVVLELNFALLTRPTPTGDDRPDQQHRVPLEHFRSPSHHLNRGYLQRSVEHANTCHQEELRRAVSTTTGIPMSRLVGVALADLSPASVQVRWIDVDGAHLTDIEFPRTARSTAELGEMLRRELHAGLC
ncbi:hypothetical protein [Nocardioides lianchengensis]|uniref:DUF2470 domain-containing protein n=1 Tax=Nocardioides lianchengensis TaxID=1045774 RepID=A0A1G6WXH0_9ACTN|nr:hypothetical protein [Nocardioides lianchengensis]NYG09185.1 hypothetical protein [Nocardioides lianchengensis]SDD69877.1 hypothetical protein SAMN05421872_11073 [Nocardioides lianchengensis]